MMKTAEDKLAAMPKDAEVAMKGAAQKLGAGGGVSPAAGGRHLPKSGASDPAAKTAIPLGGVGSGSPSKDGKLEAFQGKTWGELPGELKTRVMQEFRSRFGEEYADLIQRYFERLADTVPPPLRK